MASLTFLQLQTKVLGWLDETTDSTVVLANVKEALAAANVKRASSFEWPFMLSDATLTTIVGQRDYVLAPDFSMPVYFYNRTLRCGLRQLQRRDLPADTAPWQQIQQGGSSFTLQGNTMRLLWLPAQASVVEYQYYRQPIEMIADADVPDIPYPHSRILIYDALLALGLYSEDISPEKLGAWSKEQTDAEFALQAAYLDGNTLGSEPSFIRTSDADQ